MQPLDQEQKYYLDMLCKFSGKTNKVQVISTYEKPVLKQNYIKENFNQLTVDQQVEFNDQKNKLQEKQFQSVQMAIGLSVIGISSAVIMTPVTKSIWKPSLKLLALSMVTGFAHFKYYQYQYFEWLTNRYVQVLSKKS